MAYFSNGSEGDQFRESNCDRCIHDVNHDCSVWLIHLVRNYDQLKNTAEGTAFKGVLHTLIPQDSDGFARKCSMFHHATEAEQKEAYVHENQLSGIDKPAPWIQEWMERKKANAL